MSTSRVIGDGEEVIDGSGKLEPISSLRMIEELRSSKTSLIKSQYKTTLHVIVVLSSAIG